MQQKKYKAPKAHAPTEEELVFFERVGEIIYGRFAL